MHDTSVTKVSSAASPRGAMGQKYLASGTNNAVNLLAQGTRDEQ